MKRIALATLSVALVGSLLHAQQAPPAPQTSPGQQMQKPAQAPRLPASPPGQSATQVGGKWATPPGSDEATYTGGKWIVVDYGRPILRGRKNIFGSGADYGKMVNSGAPVWRAGANVTTRLRTEVPLVFGDKTLPAGEYSVFVDLKPAAWTLIVSNQPYQRKYDPANKTDTWGSFNYDPKFDLLRVPMRLASATPSLEQFAIEFASMTDQGGTLVMRWDATVASVPFKVGQ
jgi:hypothetical protein